MDDDDVLRLERMAEARYERERAARRQELAKDLLLKLVEASGDRAGSYVNYNVRAAVEYTDALLAELEKPNGQN